MVKETEADNDILKMDPFDNNTSVYVDQDDHHEVEKVSHRVMISARKATIRNAENILSKNIGDQNSIDTNAHATALAHSIRNKRKMDSKYVLGKALSSRTKEWSDSVHK